MKHYRVLLLLILCIAFLSSSVFSKPPKADPSKDIYYQIIIRSFYDSNGDGIGDIRGLTMKLDYLQELGVTAIWVTPICASHLYHNYFADDFYNVDPTLGTLEDFRALCTQIHSRGMKILLDMETQYVTKEHEWFKKAIADPESEYNDYIAWVDREEELPLSAIGNFTEAVSYNGTTIGLMTINMKSAKVLEYQKKLYAYWLDPNRDGDFSDGVDGYRMDHMMDDLDNKKIFTGLLANFWRPIVKYTQSIKPDIFYLAEPSNWDKQWDEILDASGFDAAFNIPQRGAIAGMARDKIAEGIPSIMKRAGEKYSFTIIENHDVTRYATDADSDPSLLRAGAVLNMTLPGVPCLYYGQELGATGERLDGQTDGNDIPIREAFRWYKDWQKKGMAVWYKMGKLPEGSFLSDEFWKEARVKVQDGTTLEEQKGNASSLWSFYKKIIALRKAAPALQSGDTKVIETGDDEVLAFVRGGAEPVFVIVNFGSKIKTPVFNLAKAGMKGSEHIDLLSGKKITAADPSKAVITLEKYQSIVMK
jgi:glycosidase